MISVGTNNTIKYKVGNLDVGLMFLGSSKIWELGAIGEEIPVGPTGYAIFDGVNDYISLGVRPEFRMGTGDMTITYTFKSTSTTPVNIISRAIAAGVDRRWAIFMIDGKLYSYVGDTQHGDNMAITPLTYNDGVEHRVVHVYDRDVGFIIYVDGTEVIRDSILATKYNGIDFNLDYDTKIGAYTQADGVRAQDFFQGSLSNMQIFNRVLTPSEISSDVTTHIQSDPNLKAYYKLNGNAQDSSPNGYHGTEYNGVTYQTL